MRDRGELFPSSNAMPLSRHTKTFNGIAQSIIGSSGGLDRARYAFNDTNGSLCWNDPGQVKPSRFENLPILPLGSFESSCDDQHINIEEIRLRRLVSLRQNSISVH